MPKDTAAAAADTATPFSVTLLDVGSKEYGDCILCQAGGDTILVDGSHPGDDQGSFSIPRQLRHLLRQPSGAIRVSLLVVTHVHSDHYGCLPELVLDGTLTADFALVADPGLGWGEVGDGGGDALFDVLAAAHPVARRVALALREEPPSAGDSTALRELLDVAASARERYEAMLDRLREDGATVVRFGVDDAGPVLERFAGVGLRILGPGREQLRICARVIRDALRDALELASGELADGGFGADGEDDVRVLQALLAREQMADVGRQKGAALNNQSVVLRLEVGGKKVLLTGDMQLADPEIEELSPFRDELRRIIRDERPYALVKVPHHASSDSFDQNVLADVTRDGEVPLLAISTGTRGEHHPGRGALQLLAATPGARWARTDRNGQVTFHFSPTETIIHRRGELNDATPKPSGNPGADAVAGDRAAPDAGSAGSRTEIVTRGPARIVFEVQEEGPLDGR